ncbi:hypothetical protein GOB94_02395 [Granulicella sp. 5B5]|uniref:hypothetical protein n=1 Tax=Granulicella sp. 5B5 TaxID=1617967 RepID=UPI0015F4E3F5|nr:hypothetical protein [Granulicella sp. 5B5]QMV17679.1 hypothetical protein GOB94_02395 [Granulicella sp. 5B5]
MPKPVRLHWGWLVVIELLTRGLFGPIWLIVQANWVRRVNGKSRAFVLSIVAACFVPAMILLGGIEGAVGATQEQIGMIVGFATIVYVVLYLWTIFQLRSELEAEPIGIPLGGGMTFFFSVIYFQYHLYDYDVEEKHVPEGSLGLSSSDIKPLA